jgi:tRNA1(Val) A37 N6-methylase TrmN6
MKENTLKNSRETIKLDDFLGGHLKIAQPLKGYRAGSDAVLLAACLKEKKSQKILEVGCGVGTASLCAAWRLKEAEIIGIDIQEHLIQIAQENAVHNQLPAYFLVQDLRAPLKALTPNSFDQVMANPPYYDKESHSVSPLPSRAISRTEEESTLLEWVRFSVYMAKPRGYITFIYPAQRVDELIYFLKQEQVGDICLVPLWPKESQDAKRIIVQVRKSVKSPARVLRGLVLHTADGNYTSEALEILKNGKAFS